MDNEKLNYIEESGLAFEIFGMTRMAGRIFGYLIVSDKEAVSFDDIREALDASKGSISGTTKQLLGVGFIEPVSLPGDRKTYYRISKSNIGAILKGRTALFLKFSALLEKGVDLKINKDDDITAWLHEMAAFYRWLAARIEHLLNSWEEEKEVFMKYENKDHGKK